MIGFVSSIRCVCLYDLEWHEVDGKTFMRCGYPGCENYDVNFEPPEIELHELSDDT